MLLLSFALTAYTMLNKQSQYSDDIIFCITIIC